jgi:hypothetical protein
MITFKQLQLMTGLTLGLFLLSGCGSPATPVPASDTPTPIPATDTPTPIPATPTPTPVPATDTPTPVPATDTPTPVPATPTLTREPTATPDENPVQVTSVEQIIGTWFWKTRYFLRFDDDGTCRQAHSLKDLDKKAYAVMYYEFKGKEMILTEKYVVGVPPCGKTAGIYELMLLSNGNLKFAEGEDDCVLRMLELLKEWIPVEDEE